MNEFEARNDNEKPLIKNIRIKKEIKEEEQ